LGQRLDPAKPVLALLKDGSELQAELYVPSRAIGFVKPGQQVRLMYDAFPYQHFGTFGGTVESVSQVMLMPQEANGSITLTEPSYRVLVITDFGENKLYRVQFLPDMTFNSFVILDHVTLLHFLFKNVIKWNNNI
jgi:membrane fusion protein